jgi:hypothetical protein
MTFADAGPEMFHVKREREGVIKKPEPYRSALISIADYSLAGG